MKQETLHIVFSVTAATVLKQALCSLGRTERVICSLDSLNLGPIHVVDLKSRLERLCIDLRSAGFAKLHKQQQQFWRCALDPSARRVAWMSRRSATEYCGFLELLHRLNDLPCELVDLTNVEVGKASGYPLALQSEESIISNNLWCSSESVIPEERSKYIRLWQSLRKENAPLRMVDADGIRSSTIDHYDPLLISAATREWIKSARVVAEILVMDSDVGFYNSDSEFLRSRIASLVERGLLEGRGSLGRLSNSEVRLPHPDVC